VGDHKGQPSANTRLVSYQARQLVKGPVEAGPFLFSIPLNLGKYAKSAGLETRTTADLEIGVTHNSKGTSRGRSLFLLESSQRFSDH
jgi:hypothetical protein